MHFELRFGCLWLRRARLEAADLAQCQFGGLAIIAAWYSKRFFEVRNF